MAEEKPDEELEDAEEGELEDQEGEDSPSSSGGKKRILILLGAAILLVGGGAGAAWYAGALDPLFAMLGAETVVEEESDQVRPVEDAFFMNLPELLVNLNTGGRKPTYLKIRISLELDKESDQPNIERVMPRIIDNFQVYLRELRVEDLKGSAGMYRLREELLTRVSAAAAPTQINDVLFKEMLVQ